MKTAYIVGPKFRLKYCKVLTVSHINLWSTEIKILWAHCGNIYISIIEVVLITVYSISYCGIDCNTNSFRITLPLPNIKGTVIDSSINHINYH